MNPQFRTPLIISLSVSLGIAAGFFFFNSPNSLVVNDNCPIDLNFVRPEQDCLSVDESIERLKKLENDLKHQVNGYLDTKRADRISVFIRDLDSQKFIYVNETEQFYTASLLKVPLAIAYFRLAELTPDLLSQKIVYDGKFDMYDNQNIKPPERLKPGTYGVDELIHRALAYSDNTAAELLYSNYVSPEYLQKILFTLGLQPKTKDPSQNILTARSYAGVFRALYNSSFLSREYSNKILDSLSESSFTEGSTALLPKDARVAHKFAERSMANIQGEIVLRQIHDCGIMYANDSEQAYSFCIMTEGKNFDDLKSVIQNTSKTIYNGIIE